MGIFQRLPEPTDIKTISETDVLVSETKLRSYLHQLLRVLQINLDIVGTADTGGSTSGGLTQSQILKRTLGC